LQIEAVTNAICAGFAKPPKMCKYLLDAVNFNSADIIFMQPRYSYAKVAAICSGIMILVVLILCCYRRYAKRKMREEINTKIEEAVN
jgi:hypothetical protein